MQADPFVPDSGSSTHLADQKIDDLWRILESRDRALSHSREQSQALQLELNHTQTLLQQAGDTIYQTQLAYQQEQTQSTFFQGVAEERLEVINQLSQVAEERLGVINQLSQVAQERLDLIHHLEQQVQQFENQVNQLQQQVTRQQQTISKLRAKVAIFRQRTHQLEQEVAFLSSGKGAWKTLQQAIIRKVGLGKNIES